MFLPPMMLEDLNLIAGELIQRVNVHREAVAVGTVKPDPQECERCEVLAKQISTFLDLHS
jgi:hypothetical protein